MRRASGRGTARRSGPLRRSMAVRRIMARPSGGGPKALSLPAMPHPLRIPPLPPSRTTRPRAAGPGRWGGGGGHQHLHHPRAPPRLFRGGCPSAASCSPASCRPGPRAADPAHRLELRRRLRMGPARARRGPGHVGRRDRPGQGRPRRPRLGPVRRRCCGRPTSYAQATLGDATWAALAARYDERHHRAADAGGPLPPGGVRPELARRAGRGRRGAETP